MSFLLFGFSKYYDCIFPGQTFTDRERVVQLTNALEEGDQAKKKPRRGVVIFIRAAVNEEQKWKTSGTIVLPLACHRAQLTNTGILQDGQPTCLDLTSRESMIF